MIGSPINYADRLIGSSINSQSTARALRSPQGEAPQGNTLMPGSERQAACAGALKPVYWQALSVVVVLYFARFDWSFVVLRAKMVGLTP
jgi:hypothetical protein